MKYCFYQTFKQVIERHAIVANQPLIEAVTYRLAAHSTADTPSRYRNNEEVEEWRRHDPLPSATRENGVMG
jgi:pyruvate dehydrogenase E1 component alpha subunit